MSWALQAAVLEEQFVRDEQDDDNLEKDQFVMITLFPPPHWEKSLHPVGIHVWG